MKNNKPQKVKSEKRAILQSKNLNKGNSELEKKCTRAIQKMTILKMSNLEKGSSGKQTNKNTTMKRKDLKRDHSEKEHLKQGTSGK